MPEMTRNDTMTPAEVADFFRVSPDTVARWADEGRLPCFRTPGGQRRYRRTDVEAFAPSETPGELA